jgi:uroporphyrinogen-III synthase
LAIKSILVSQPKPDSDKSPYFDLAKKYNLQVDFRPFIQVEGVPATEFRQSKINYGDHGGIILNSKNAVDHFFRLAKDLRYTIPDSLKYFCLTESTAFYLQKYVVYRKRKIFYGNQKIEDLIDVLKKNKEEHFMIPCSDIHGDEISKILDQNKLKYSKAVMYRTVASDLSDLSDIKYDMLVFFSPSGVESLFKNFPDFVQNTTRIAAFGATTAQTVIDKGLRLDVMAPMPKAPSMTMAIEQFIASEK